MGAWRTPREGGRAATLPILTQFRVFVKTSIEEFSGFGVPPPGLVGARRTRTDTRRPWPFPAPLFRRREVTRTSHRVPLEAAEPGQETTSDDAGSGRSLSPPQPAGGPPSRPR